MPGDVNEELRFCLVIYFLSVRSQSWMELFSEVALKYATELERFLTHFEFWPKDNKTRTSVLQYIKRNQKRLTKAFNSGIYRGISFYSKDEGLFWSPLYLSLVTKEPLLLRIAGMEDSIVYYDYGTLLMDCKLDYLKDRNTELSIVSKHFLHDIKPVVNLGYGFVTVMQERKYPRFYFINSASSPDLAPKEEQESRIWEREGRRFQTIMRDIYWGNVLTRSHWGNDKAKEEYLLKAIEHECKGNVSWIDENTLFFCAPFDVCTQDDPKMLNFKEHMYKVFDKCEIEIIRANIGNYPGPQNETKIDVLQKDTGKKHKKLRSKKRLIIQYQITKDSRQTKEHKCIFKIFQQMGPLPLIIKKEETQDGLQGEITIDGSKVSRVRKAIVYCVEKMNMKIKMNPPIDKEDTIHDMDLEEI